MNDISYDEKSQHHDDLERFIQMINQLVLNDLNITINNVAYAVPLEGDLLYFDYPYTRDVEKLNYDLANDTKLRGSDQEIYARFTNQNTASEFPEDEYILWTYEEELTDGLVTGYQVRLIQNNIGFDERDERLLHFLPIMISSGKPEVSYLLPVGWQQPAQSTDNVKTLLMLCKRLGSKESDVTSKGAAKHTLICSFCGRGQMADVLDMTKRLYEKVYYFLECYFGSPVLSKMNASIKRGQQRTAIISILVDSYAHNISAHSMVALEEWFRNRAEMLEKKIYKNGGTKTIDFPRKQLSNQQLSTISRQAAAYYEVLGLGDQTNTVEYLSLADMIRLEGFDAEAHFTGYSVLLNELVGREITPSDAPALLDSAGLPMPEKHRFPVPVDYALWQFFRFMKGKAAFWSGVTRDLPFGGEHISLYDLLYKHLAENPLYLGTIVHSEGINKLNIKIGLDKHFIEDQQNEITFYDFLQIDTSLIKGKSPASDAVHSSTNPFNSFELATAEIAYSPYGFLRFGKYFEKLREIFTYNVKKAFLPGGLVGVHSFLTIIENTIRNVKHYKHHIIQAHSESDNFDDLIKNGVTLLITFEQMDLFDQKISLGETSGKTGQPRLYRTGVALGHRISTAGNKAPEDLLAHKLMGEITDDELGKARLGGTSQDKICAAMLLNNKFMSVENTSTRRDKYYYPWIAPAQLSYSALTAGNTRSHPALTFNTETSHDQKRNVKKEKLDYLNNFLEQADGQEKPVGGEYLFKFFNIWMSEEIICLDDTNALSDEQRVDNYARFKFGVLKPGASSKYLRKLGETREERQTFRIIETDTPNLSPADAYKLWNEQIFRTGTDVGAKIYDMPIAENPIPVPLWGLTNKVIIEAEPMMKHAVKELTLQPGDLIFAHGNNPDHTKVLNYRGHGILAEKFAYDGVISRGVVEEAQNEFIETVLLTVKIWDDRIYERIKKETTNPIQKYSTSLRLHFFPESDQHIEQLREEQKVHQILIVHLSFIEYLKNKFQKSEDQQMNLINWFIRTYLNSGDIDFRKLTLAIISGRGNAEWFNKIDSEYLPIIIYRPVESVLDAIEDALVYGDDFQLKYNICKSIMGS